jgi:hypothetical protein
LLFTQEINIKEETFGISSSSTSREDHEARHKSRHEVNKTPNNARIEAQHAKLQGFGCLPTRSTQPERYSHSPGQHDLSVQIRRLKQPLMAKI